MIGKHNYTKECPVLNKIIEVRKSYKHSTRKGPISPVIGLKGLKALYIEQVGSRQLISRGGPIGKNRGLFFLVLF